MTFVGSKHLCLWGPLLPLKKKTQTLKILLYNHIAIEIDIIQADFNIMYLLLLYFSSDFKINCY